MEDSIGTMNPLKDYLIEVWALIRYFEAATKMVQKGVLNGALCYERRQNS